MNLASGSYYLTGDIDLNDSPLSSFGSHGFVITNNAEVNLCLNGYCIKGYLNSSIANTNIFYIDSGSTLNLYDCNKTQQKHYFTEKDSSDPSKNYWVPSDTETSLSLDGGYLYCNDCLAVGTSGTFNMYGGSIVGYSTKELGPFPSHGFPKTILSSTNSSAAEINIKGGAIVGCNTVNGIVHISGAAAFNMEGGEIKNSYASNLIRIYSVANIIGGKIYNNVSMENGISGISNGKIKIAGTAEITNNFSLNAKAGCCVSAYKTECLSLGGKAKVIKNKHTAVADLNKPYAEKLNGGVLSNIALIMYDETPKTLIPITDGDEKLENGARFGVTGIKYNQSERKYEHIEHRLTEALTESCKKYFFADNSDFIVNELEDKSLKLVKITDPVNPGESIKIAESKMPEGKPTVENVELTKGKLDKSIEVVIKDKEDLGKIKEKVDENIKKQLTSNTNLISQFDISLEQDGVEIENIDGNEYKVTLKLPDNYSGLSKQNVIYITVDGSVETKETTVTGNKCSFVTTHFSTWGFAAEGKLSPDPTPTPPSGGLTTAAIAGIAVGSTAGTGTIFFVIFIVFFRKKLRFVMNGRIIYETNLKWRDKIDFDNKNIAGKKWFNDKQLSKSFKRTKMGLFGKTVYNNKCDYVDITVIYGHTLEEYNKKYKNRTYQLVKLTKKAVEEFNKKYPTICKEYLLKNHKWWFIEGTYYEIPKHFTCAWFSNLFNHK